MCLFFSSCGSIFIGCICLQQNSHGNLGICCWTYCFNKDPTRPADNSIVKSTVEQMRNQCVKIWENWNLKPVPEWGELLWCPGPSCRVRRCVTSLRYFGKVLTENTRPDLNPTSVPLWKPHVTHRLNRPIVWRFKVTFDLCAPPQLNGDVGLNEGRLPSDEQFRCRNKLVYIANNKQCKHLSSGCNHL